MDHEVMLGRIRLDLRMLGIILIHVIHPLLLAAAISLLVPANLLRSSVKEYVRLYQTARVELFHYLVGYIFRGKIESSRVVVDQDEWGRVTKISPLRQDFGHRFALESMNKPLGNMDGDCKGWEIQNVK